MIRFYAFSHYEWAVTQRASVSLLLVQHQPQMMAHAIQRLVHDKDLAAQLSKNGSKIVEEKWSVNAAVERLERQLIQAATSKAFSNSE